MCLVYNPAPKERVRSILDHECGLPERLADPMVPTQREPLRGVQQRPAPVSCARGCPVPRAHASSDGARRWVGVSRDPCTTTHTTAAAADAAHATHNLLLLQCLGSLMYKQQVISCLDWSPDPSRPYSIAAGLPSGRVVILDFQKELDSLRDDRCVRKPMCVSVEF